MLAIMRPTSNREWPGRSGRSGRQVGWPRQASRHPAQALMPALVALAVVIALAAQSPDGTSLPPWTRGTLDIHQLATGRGNSALIVLPDGTTMLVDAGPGGDAIAAYIERALAPASARLDYAVLTHFHSDHAGGIAEVAARVPIARLIDRGDDYLRPVEGDPTYTQYRRFVASRGLAREAIRVGRADQIGRASCRERLEVA